MRSAKRGSVIGPSNIQFAGTYMCTFQPGNLTDRGNERVKALIVVWTEDWDSMDTKTDQLTLRGGHLQHH